VSRRYLCLACWRRLPQGEALARASAKDQAVPAWMRAPGEGALRPVGAGRGRGLAGLLLDDEPPAADGVDLFCPCGAPLTARSALDGEEELGLGFAGPRAAGKTLLTLAAVRALDGARVDGERVSLFGVGDTPRRFRELAADFLHEHRQAEATRLEPPPEQLVHGTGEITHLAWELFAGRGRERAGVVAVYDLAGETWGLPAHERRERFDRYLGLVTSLVFVVDGASVAADLGLDPRDAWDPEPRRGDGGARDEEWLGAVLDRLGGRAREVDLAVALTKGDLLWEEPRWAGLRPEAAADGPAGGEDAGSGAVREAADDDEGGEGAASGGAGRDGAAARRPDRGDARAGDEHAPQRRAGRRRSAAHDDFAAERAAVRSAAVAAAIEESGRAGLLRAAEAHFREVALFGVSSLGFRPGPGDVDAAGRLLRAPRPAGVIEPLLWLLGRRVRVLRGRR
jgi:hypothetical protein